MEKSALIRPRDAIYAVYFFQLPCSPIHRWSDTTLMNAVEVPKHRILCLEITLLEKDQFHFISCLDKQLLQGLYESDH